MILPSSIVAVASHASDEKTRYALNAVRIETTKEHAKVVATDGRRLCRVVVTRSVLDEDDYPAVDGLSAIAGEPQSFQLEAKEFAALKGLPVAKGRHAKAKPILANIVLDEHKTLANGSAHFGATNLEATGQKDIRKETESYPDYEAVIPTEERIGATLDAAYLMDALKVAIALNTNSEGKCYVRLSLAKKDSKHSPVLVTAKTLGIETTVVIMPIAEGA